MIIASKFHVPDHCPETCPFIEEYRKFVVGMVCESCPVFLCKVVTYEDEVLNLVPPESFDLTSARKWEKWFREGMRKAPPGRRRMANRPVAAPLARPEPVRRRRKTLKRPRVSRASERATPMEL